MEDERDLRFEYRSPIEYASTTCITNDYSGKISCISYNNRGSINDPLSLFDEQQLTTGRSCEECTTSSEPFCHLQFEYVDKLKESTKQLLSLLEEIQSKTHTKIIIPDRTPKFAKAFKSDLQDYDGSKKNFNTALRKLETNAKNLDAIYVENEHDSCTIYSRLTRKCLCLNHPDYNDFVIHFNEDSKYTTSNLGEIIKNMRILRKFLYMGGNYTRNALMFLNEGMMESPHSERVEMTQACVNADICNIFDDQSIVIVCISWPCKNKHYGDYVTQALAAGLLYKLAQIEEGRRYLNYSSKISNDIKKILRKRSASIEVNTIESLNATLDLLKPVFVRNMSLNHVKQSIYEGVGKRTIYDLVKHRKYMTYDEILMHLDMLDSYSQYDSGRPELILHLPLMLILFKHLIIEYDNSEINVTITSIINNIVDNINTIEIQESEKSNANMILIEKGTQAINKMKSEECQFPPKKTKKHKSKVTLGGPPPNKFRQPSKRKVSDWEPSKTRILNKSKKFNNNDPTNKSIIFVPNEK